MAEESKHDVLLKRIQILLAIIAGIITVILGAYNIKKNLFSKDQPEAVVVAPPPQVESVPRPGAKLQSALEDAGVSWIQNLKKTKTDTNSAGS